jgi:flagellar basal body rod protein FlgF
MNVSLSAVSSAPASATAAGAIKALQGKRDSLQRRCEGLLKCKAEFQEIARAL